MVLHESGGKGGENTDDRYGQGGEDVHMRHSFTQNQRIESPNNIEEDWPKVERSKTLGGNMLKNHLMITGLKDDDNKDSEFGKSE